MSKFDRFSKVCLKNVSRVFFEHRPNVMFREEMEMVNKKCIQRVGVYGIKIKFK